MMRMLFVMVCLVLTSGCAKKYCEQEREFNHAREYPTLSAPPGMEVPASDPSMMIPPVSGDERSAISESRPCLEIPPRMRDEA